MVAKTKPTQVLTQLQTKVSYRKQKIRITPETKIQLHGRKLEIEKRRVIFWRVLETFQKLKKD